MSRHQIVVSAGMGLWRMFNAKRPSGGMGGGQLLGRGKREKVERKIIKKLDIMPIVTEDGNKETWENA